MPEGIKQEKKTSIETMEEKKARLNALWRNKKETFEYQGKKYNLEDCYKYEIKRREEAFKKINTIAEQIPKDMYVLFIDSVEKGQGTIGHPDFKLIDEDRRKMMFLAETGSDDLEQDFQPENMRYRLGFKKGDKRFRVYKSFRDTPPDELKNCAGIVFSGSALNVFVKKGEVEPKKNIKAKKNVQKIITMAREAQVPQLGICFGAQSIIKNYGGEIEIIHDKDGNETRVVGITQIAITDAGKENEFTEKLNNLESVAQNHGQQANMESLKKIGAEILAVSADTQAPEIVLLPPYAICTQSHIEGDPTRDSIIRSSTNTEKDYNPIETFFVHNPTEAGEVIFPKYMETLVKHAKARNFS